MLEKESNELGYSLENEFKLYKNENKGITSIIADRLSWQR